MNFFFWRHEPVVEARPVAPAPMLPAGRPASPPTVVAPNPAIRDMEKSLATLVYRLTETLAKTELYFPASDLAALGLPAESHTLCSRTNRMATTLLLRADIKRGERYVVYSGEIAGALRIAERAAAHLRLLCTDPANAPALPLVRRVAEACERVISLSAKVLNAESADVFRHANALVSAQNDAQTAVHKAVTLLSKRPALCVVSTENMARTTIWAMEIAAETVSRTALECRGALLPASVLPETVRDTVYNRPALRSAFAPV